MTLLDVAQLLRMAAAEAEQDRPATARHFAEKALRELGGPTLPLCRLRVLRGERVETKGEG